MEKPGDCCPINLWGPSAYYIEINAVTVIHDCAELRPFSLE